MLRTIKQGHVHASSVRSVIMDNLIVRSLDFRLVHEVFQHVSVLYLAESQHSMESLVLLGHRLDYSSDVVEFLLIFRICPLVLSLRKELIVVLSLIVVRIEQVLDIVKAENIAFWTTGVC